MRLSCRAAAKELSWFNLQISQIEFLPVFFLADYSLSGHEVTSGW